MSDERIWRCECGHEAVGVSFFSPFKDDPASWFIEVYKLGGIASRRWRLKNAANMLLGRDVYIEAVSLDAPKVRELLAFLQSNIAECEVAPDVTVSGVNTHSTFTR